MIRVLVLSIHLSFKFHSFIYFVKGERSLLAVKHVYCDCLIVCVLAF